MQEFETVLAGAATAPASIDEGHLPLIRRVHRTLHGAPTIIPAIILVLAVAVFSAIVGKRFFDPFNLSLVLQQVTIIGTVGVAQTIVVLTAGIDLSVGAIMVLSSVVMGRLAVAHEWPVIFAFLIGIGVGVACGAINGALVTRLRLPPFIATLGTWSVFFGLNLWYSNSETIRGTDIDVTAPFLSWTGSAFRLFGGRLTYGSILMLIMTAVFWYILRWTAFGTAIHAVGDDPDSARLAGIRDRRTLFNVYTIAGLICGIAGWVLVGRVGAISPQSGYTANLDSITAVVIGGTSLFGGRGSIWGTLIGALIVGVFRNGLALSGVDVLWQEVAVGILIIAAVAIDQWIRQATE
jgi:fructose transport system permease protein